MPLYPKKNLFTFEGSKLTSAGGSSLEIVTKGTAIVTSNQNSFTAIETLPVKVKPYTDYNINYTCERGSIDNPRVSPRKNSDRSGITTNDGGGYKSLTFNTGSETEIYFLMYANLTTTGTVQTNKYTHVMLTEAPAQPYEPFELGMKRDSFKKDTVYPGISGSSHVATAADVFAVKRDVRVGKAQISIATTGVFKVAIYEWVDGVGRIGNPVYQNDTTYDSTGVYTYDFGGVLLKAGKNYWIGRYEDTGGASANRTLSAVIPNETYKHVTWLGGTSYTSTTLAYPTTYYYFYGLEFEAVNMKKAPLLPERNLIPDFNDPRWVIDKKVPGGNAVLVPDADNPHRASITIEISAQARLIQIPVKSGKTYTFQFGSITGLYRILKGWTDSYNNIPIVGQDSKVLRFTPDDTYNGFVTIRLTHGNPGTYRFEDIQLLEGDYSTVQTFTPYNPVKLKDTTLVPKKNLIPRQNLVFGSWQGVPSALNFGSSLYYAIPTPLRLKPGTYTVSSRGDVNAAIVNGATIYLSSSNDLPRQVTITYETDVYIHFRKKDNTAWGSFPTDTHELGIQLEAGSQTEYKPYELGMKPAILYPKKNLLPGDVQYNSEIVPESAYSFLINDTDGSGYTFIPWQPFSVKPNTTYTLSFIKEVFLNNIGVQVEKEDGTTITSVSSFPATFNTGANNKIRLRFWRTLAAPSLIRVSKWQLEEGSVATPFEPYESAMKQ